MSQAPPARSFAEERRIQIRAQAEAIGIDEAYISRLVDSFYIRIRVDPVLGPIFDGAIGDNWDIHLAKMKQFWASVALNTGVYSGRPVPVHQRLEGISRRHFDLWLDLFEATLRETAPTAEAVGYFLLRARRIGASLQMAMFERPSRPGGPAPIFSGPPWPG